MKLFNTLSRTLETLKPIKDKTIGLYACGPTVYDFAHLGHMRGYTMNDVLVRALRHAGFTVKHVMNITDVGHLVSDADEGEDKMEKGARKYGASVWELAQRFETFFWKSIDAMHIKRPDISCRATDHIKEQIVLIQQLEKNGYVYVINDGVYFDTAKFPDYGKLARLNIESLKAGARVEIVKGKKSVTDFALWKLSPHHEKRQMEWDSPWGKGFPGWHIECSAMSMKYLGEQFEIHTGGIDHIPVHHTNEIAQSEAATGKKPFVKYWVHHNFLRIDNEKMSKSLGNFYTIDDVVKRGFSPMALRLLFLGAHYRDELNFTWDALQASQTAWERLLKLVEQFQKEDGRTELSQEKVKKIDDYRTRFFTAIENDLNTPQALSVFWEVIKSNVSSGDKFELVREFDEVLGLEIEKHAEEFAMARKISTAEEVPAKVKDLANERKTAKDRKDFVRADALRKQIEEKGWKVVDTEQGYQLSLRIER